MAKAQIIAGLEIAHAKLRMVILENGSFLYASEVDCLDGIKNGAVINLDNVTEAIIRLLENINYKTGEKINSVCVNISGADIKRQIVNSVTTLPQRGYEITGENTDDLIESCKAVSIPLSRYLLYFLPLEYIIDGQDGIKDPVGLCGNRLETNIFIVTAPFNQVQNITRAVNAAGLEIEELILTTLAAANSVLNVEEKKDGILLIDFKTDLTEMGIFKEGNLTFFETIPRGQEAITMEIASRFNISFGLAEELKIKYGFLDNAKQVDRRNQDVLPLEWMGSRQEISREELNKIINEQCGLFFGLILEKIKGLKNFNNIIKKGAVANGGCTSMEGFLEGAAQKFGFTIRAGIPKHDMGPVENKHITSSGLAVCGLEKRIKARRGSESNFFRKVYQKAGELLADYF